MTSQFELLEEIGRGGMGVVYRARDLVSGEILAVKLMRDFIADDAVAISRFEREVELVRRIDSPHVVSVRGFGRYTGVPFLAMEYVDGVSLREHLQTRGPISVDEATVLARQVALGLMAVHAAGVIHRDIKPSNILMSTNDGAKLADFGVSRAIDLTRVTTTAAAIGTPHYMAPDPDESPSSDLYSLGCVLFEALTGATPFQGDTMHKVLVAHLRDTPDWTLLPAGTREMVRWLLQREPLQRPASAGQFIATLDGVGSFPLQLPVPTAARPPAPTQVKRSRRRSRALLALVPVVVLAAGEAAVMSLRDPGDRPAVFSSAHDPGPTISGATVGPAGGGGETITGTPGQGGAAGTTLTEVAAAAWNEPQRSPTMIATTAPATTVPATAAPTSPVVAPATATATTAIALKNAITITGLSPAPGASLQLGDRITVSVSYSTNVAKGVRIWAFAQSPCASFGNPSGLFYGAGTSSHTFVGLGGGCSDSRITGIRVDLVRDDRDIGGGQEVLASATAGGTYFYPSINSAASVFELLHEPEGTLLVRGNNFAEDSVFMLDGLALPTYYLSAFTLRVTLPANVPEHGMAVVWNSGGGGPSSPIAFDASAWAKLSDSLERGLDHLHSEIRRDVLR